MKTKTFSYAMNEINDKYIEEAIGYIPKSKNHTWYKWGAAAACFLVLCTAAAVLAARLSGQTDTQSPEPPSGILANAPDTSAADTAQPTATLHIDPNSIHVNEMDASADTVRIWYDPELYDTVFWDRDAVIAYYGTDLSPAYIPSGLIPAPGNGTASVIMRKDQTIAEDTIGLSYYHDYYEDGSPRLTEDVAAVKGLSITASRLGLLNDCCYILPEDEENVSDIGGIPVTIGCRSMPYGPYDPETHEPSGYYDLYVAEFEYEDIEYQIIAEQLELEELVKVTASIIHGSDDIVIDQ